MKIESRLTKRVEDDVGYESVRYSTIGMILDNLPISRDDVFFEVGYEMVRCCLSTKRMRSEGEFAWFILFGPVAAVHQ